jgi:hypothetical protein
MATLTEGQLEFTFAGELAAFKLDDQSTHGLSHCMKAVDFVVEFTDHVLFVEVKDPDNTNARPKQRQKFAEKLESGKLTHDLCQKYRDSWLYQWAKKPPEKPIRYVVLLQLLPLQPLALMSLADGLRRQLPLSGASSWKRQLAESVNILDLNAWNRTPGLGTVRRV